MPEPWLQMATLDLDTKNYAEAEQIFKRLYKPGKGDIRPLKGLVVVYLAQQQPKKALALAREEAARSNDPQVRILLASTAAQTGDFDLALSTAEGLTAEFPANPDHLVFVGQLYQQRGQTDRAIAAFRSAQAKAPKDPIPGMHLAAALEQAGQLDEAVNVSRNTLKTRPDDPQLMNGLAWYLAREGKKFDEAADLVKRALQKEPTNAAFLDTAGMIDLKSKQPARAVPTFQQLVRRAPNSASYRTHLAEALLASGDRQRARTELETALRSHPSGSEEQEIRHVLASIR
jgi:predicted Zn-dependent protease